MGERRPGPRTLPSWPGPDHPSPPPASSPGALTSPKLRFHPAWLGQLPPKSSFAGQDAAPFSLLYQPGPHFSDSLSSMPTSAPCPGLVTSPVPLSASAWALAAQPVLTPAELRTLRINHLASWTPSGLLGHHLAGAPFQVRRQGLALSPSARCLFVAITSCLTLLSLWFPPSWPL